MIEIRFVGTTPVIEDHTVRACTSNAVIIDEEVLLFDCGRYASSQLFRTGIPPYKVTHLFFTHNFHFDHTSDYPNLIFSRFNHHETPLKVYGPQGTKELTEKIFETFVHKTESPLFGEILVKDLEEGDTMTGKHWKSSCVYTNHGDFYEKKSLAYKLVSGGKSIVFSGDVGCGRSDVSKSNAYALNKGLISFAKGADVFVMDADLMHTCFSDVGWAAKASNAKHVVLTHMHLPEWSSLFDSSVRQGSDEEVIEEIREIYDGVVTIAKDLNSIYI